MSITLASGAMICTSRPSTDAKVVRKTSWRRMIALKLSLKSFHLERPDQTHGKGCIEDWETGKYPLDSPDTLLVHGSWQSLLSWYGNNRGI